MSLLTTISDTNKVQSNSPIVKYSASPVTNVVNGVSYVVAWELTRTSAYNFSYLGLTRAAAETNAASLQQQFTRKYMRFECDIVENEKDPLKPNVIISPVFAWECSTSVEPHQSAGDAWQIDVSVNDTDTVFTTEQVTDAADLEGLFQAAAARDTPAGTDHIEITTARWDSTRSVIRINYTQGISGYNKINLKAEVWNKDSSQWETKNLSSVTDDSAAISQMTENKKFRLSYDNGRVKSEAYTTRDNEVPIVEITDAVMKVDKASLVYMSSTYTYFKSNGHITFKVRIKGGATLANLKLSLSWFPGGGSEEYDLSQKLSAAQRQPVLVEDEWYYYEFELAVNSNYGDAVAMLYNIDKQVYGSYHSDNFNVVKKDYINITSITANADRQAVVEFTTDVPSTRMNVSNLTLLEYAIETVQRYAYPVRSLVELNSGTLEQLSDNSWRYTSKVSEGVGVINGTDTTQTKCSGEFALTFTDDLGFANSPVYSMTWPEQPQTILNVSLTHDYTASGGGTFSPSLGPVKLFTGFDYCSSSGNTNAGKANGADIVTMTVPGSGRVAADATATWTTALVSGSTPRFTPTTVTCRLMGALSEIPNNFIGGTGSTLYQKVKFVSISGAIPTIGASAFVGLRELRLEEHTVAQARAASGFPFGLTAGSRIVCKDGTINLNAITIDYSGTAANNTVSLGKIYSSEGATIYVDWDDGTAVESYNSLDYPSYEITGVNHTYATTGQRLIRIYCSNVTGMDSIGSQDGGPFVVCTDGVINEVQVPATTIGYLDRAAFINIGTRIVIEGDISLGINAFYSGSHVPPYPADEIVFYGGITSSENSSFNYQGGTTPDITFKTKTMSQVRAFANYPWQLSLGTEIHCTDGDIVVGE